MDANEQARKMIEIHGDSALVEHEKIMSNIRSLYNEDHDKAIKESMNYPHLLEVEKILLYIIKEL